MQKQLTFEFPRRSCFFSGRPMLQLKLYFPDPPKGIRGITHQYMLSLNMLPEKNMLPLEKLSRDTLRPNHLPIAAACFPMTERLWQAADPSLPACDKKNRRQLTLFD